MNVGYGLEIPVQSVAEDSSTTVTGSESVFGTTRSVDKVESTDYNSENALENCMWPNALQVRNSKSTKCCFF